MKSLDLLSEDVQRMFRDGAFSQIRAYEYGVVPTSTRRWLNCLETNAHLSARRGWLLPTPQTTDVGSELA